MSAVLYGTAIAALVLVLLETWYFGFLLIIQVAGNSESPWRDAAYFWRELPTPWRYFWSRP